MEKGLQIELKLTSDGYVQLVGPMVVAKVAIMN